MTVNADDAVEVSPHMFVIDASTLGLPPGVWPETVTTQSLGNGLPFIKCDERADAVIYRQVLGAAELHILND